MWSEVSPFQNSELLYLIDFHILFVVLCPDKKKLNLFVKICQILHMFCLNNQKNCRKHLKKKENILIVLKSFFLIFFS